MPGNRSENRKMTQRKRDRSICSLNRSPLVGNSAHSCWASFGKLCQMCLIIVHTRDGSGEHSPPVPYPKLSRLPLGCCFPVLPASPGVNARWVLQLIRTVAAQKRWHREQEMRGSREVGSPLQSWPRQQWLEERWAERLWGEAQEMLSTASNRRGRKKPLWRKQGQRTWMNPWEIKIGWHNWKA